MNYFKDFKWNVALQRVAIVVLVMFLNAFSKSWISTHELMPSLLAGSDVLIPAIIAGLGLDQIVFNFMKQPEIKETVQAMRVFRAQNAAPKNDE